MEKVTEGNERRARPGSVRSGGTGEPDLSLVLPCHNEADAIRGTVTRLAQGFRERNIDLQLVLVDNGSRDDTGKIIEELVQEGLPVVKAVVQVNQGYGNGVLQGLPLCRGRLVGFMCADEQVAATDVVKLYEAAAKAKTPKLFKVRRRFRMESLLRRVVSVTYNMMTRLLFGDLGSMDLNANPKILPREYLERMNLRSKDWFLDPEVMIKAKALGLVVFEMNIFAQMRAEGVSNVRPATCWEFLVNLLTYRFGRHRLVPPAKPLAPAICVEPPRPPSGTPAR